MSNGEVLIRAEHVSKKFCRSLKRSLWYGAQDITNCLIPWKREPGRGDIGADGGFVEPALRKDEFWAVRDVSFEVRRGECLGLIGHNGAGKSTLLKMLNSLNRPDSGRMTMRGRVGALIELSAGFNPILTGRENIYNQAALLGFSKKQTDTKFDAIVDFSELEIFLDTPVQNYSSGMKVRLGFAVASHMEPDILLIDEVLAVGDVSFRLKCLNQLANVLTRSAVIFVSHSISQIHRVCSNLIVMENGMSSYYGGNISEGVTQYLAKSRSLDSSAYGSGEIAIEQLINANNNCESELGQVVHIPQDSAIEFELVLRSKLDLCQCKLGIVIWNSELYPIAELVSEDGAVHFLELSGADQNIFSVRIENPNLAAGRYSLSLHLIDPESTKVFLRVDNALVIVVSGPVLGSGGNIVTSTVKKVQAISGRH